MSLLQINANPTFTIDVTVRESDEYSKAVYVKFERNVIPEDVHGCHEMFLTPGQLEHLGRFFMRKADEIRTEQANRL